MGRRNVERALYNSLSYRSGKLSNSCVNFLGVEQFSAVQFLGTSKNTKGPVDKVHTKNVDKIKIGKKIYLLKTGDFGTRDKTLKAARYACTEPDIDKVFQRAPRQKKLIESRFITKSQTFVTKLEAPVKVQDNFLAGHSVSGPESQNSAMSSESVLGPSPQSFTCEGLDINSILKHPLYNTHIIKPFVSKDSPAFKVKRPVTNYPYHIATVRDVLQGTSGPNAAKRMAAWRENTLRKLGTESFQEYRDDLRRSGLDFENLICEYLKKGDDSLCAVNPVMEALWESLKPVLNDVKNPLCIQKRVLHPTLRYTGVVDCVATYRSKQVMIEWKKTYRMKNALHMILDDPTQTVALLGALNFDPAWPYQVKECLLVFANSDGSPAHVHMITEDNAQVYWKFWVRRLEQFWKNFDGKCTDAKLKNQARGLFNFEEISATSANGPVVINDTMAQSVDAPIQVANVKLEAANEEPAQPQSFSADEKKQESSKLELMSEHREECVLLSDQQQNILHEGKRDNCKPSDTNSNPIKRQGLIKSLWNLWKR